MIWICLTFFLKYVSNLSQHIIQTLPGAHFFGIRIQPYLYYLMCHLYIVVGFFSKYINQRRDKNITWISKSFDLSTGLQSLVQHLFLNKLTEYWLCSLSVMSLKLFSLVFLLSMFHITGISIFLKQKSGYTIACKDMHVTQSTSWIYFILLSRCALSFFLPVYLHYCIFLQPLTVPYPNFCQLYLEYTSYF